MQLLDMADNYFWRVYVNGAYLPECCPSYLHEEHFDLLRDRSERIRPWT